MIQRLGLALILVTASLLPAAVAAQGRTTYCCTDDSGRQVCSDVLPQECYGKAYREISPQGRTLRRIDAPLNAEQRAAREAKDRKAREEELKRLEQERRNRALLATYASEQDIDYVRDRTIGDVRKSIQASQEKLVELADKQKKLDAEAEFYKKRPMPPALGAQIRDNQTEMKALQTAIDGRKNDIESLKAKYEEEKLRYRELTQKKTTVQGGTATPAGPDSRPR
ncbi:conserved hypothetical protein [Candidatus Desulfobacillus denitrificans]|uniref:DUF4124 domain-containing protein n=1 Tax=Candidatus Desulfobacillus denitrificans TaxID=2608985 RepID=A0A809R3P6_9PROT|nr:hypothetical protein [Rhodocyclaceae bacterium]BBO22223.1 conserved hypothetical protein [Candidatus Desulfobacillus denitrificans]GIK45650.1 MAG: hypothetical protein BroJett012_15530 [Betaproteobacteria bacterium]